MNNSIHIKIIKYFLVVFITLVVGGILSVVSPAIIGIFMNKYEDTNKIIMSIISNFLISLFFFIPYSVTFIIPKGKDKSSFELSISKNIDMKNFVKSHIKANAIIDFLIYVTFSLPIMIYLTLNSVPFSEVPVFITIISPQLLFFYRVIDTTPIISYLLSVLFFCIGYTLCFIITYRRLAKHLPL